MSSKKKNYGKIRKSQFIFSFGPGSFFEDPLMGTGIIKSLSEENFFRKGSDGRRLYNCSKFEIEDGGILKEIVSSYLSGIDTEPNVRNMDLDKLRFFEIPGYEDETGKNIFGIQIECFPDWKLCLKCGVLYKSANCPKCGQGNHPRFRIVAACPNGHLDNLQLGFLVHKYSKKDCEFKFDSDEVYFKWEGKGTAASQIQIKCPKCDDASISLGQLMKTEYSCSKRYPERFENQYSESCDKKMKPILIHASNIKLNEVLSVFTVKPSYTSVINNLLKDLNCLKTLAVLPDFPDEEICKKTVKAILTSSCNEEARNILEKILLSEEISCSDLLKKIKQIYNDYKTVQSYKHIDKECLTLFEGTEKGIPPEDPVDKRSEPLFVINKEKKIQLGKLTFQAIDVLTVYHVLLGYRRLDPSNKLVLTYAVCNNEYWFPAVKNTGEGIFIYPSEDLIKVVNELGNKNQTIIKLGEILTDEEKRKKLPRDPLGRQEVYGEPLFIFLHTLAHILIRYFGTVVGYSSASLRERIYVCNLKLNDKQIKRGGILIYTASEDADGSMGGLISFVQNLKNNPSLREEFAEQLREYITYCSNDPVCIDQDFDDRTLSRAACYACSLVPETSCEFQNKLLDRKLLLEILSNYDFLSL